MANWHSLDSRRQVAAGLRFVHWCHASENVDAQKDPKNNPTVLVYQHLEDELHRAGAGSEAILALTTTRDGATNLRNYFEITGSRQMLKLQSKWQELPQSTALPAHRLS